MRSDGISAMRCLQRLATKLEKWKCYIQGELGNQIPKCRCSVEQQGEEEYFASVVSNYYDAMDHTWKMQEPLEPKWRPNWGIIDHHNLTLMYWCDDALKENWWRRNYGGVPRHFHQLGWLKNNGRRIPSKTYRSFWK
jgi:hypothetical protein